jgi:SAM-dependent methyltransferase
VSATERWSQALAAWAIPPEILAAAPESPWGYPTRLFARRADDRPTADTPSTQQARAALPDGGVVLDVGCGAGASSLPLADRASHLIGVDSSPGMLRAFHARVEETGAAVTTIAGSWPAVADETPVADVVVCHHVAYNVPDLAPFIRRLTDHARHRIVMELTALHPLSPLNDLWRHFHGLIRPTAPSADDAVAVLRECGITPEFVRWESSAQGWSGPSAYDDLVVWTRRRLCLPPERDPEIAAILRPQVITQDGGVNLPPRPVVTLWWGGTAT